ncbi:MAG TPA: tetratricopeptide repeat protein, partial [Bryobacteraceae bacterium]|nr:tetratricopeptide repeat protein [Bryobacteraceae bacterium]
SAHSMLEVERTVQTLYEQGDWTGTIRAASEAHEHSKDLYLYQGLALARLNRLDEAEGVFLRARQAYPKDPRFALELAGIAYRNKDLAAAKNYLHDALRLSPADNYGNDFLASLYILDGNIEAALKYWNRIGQPLVQTFQFAPDLELNPVPRERAFAISPGQVFTRKRLLMTESNLDRLGVLSSYQFDLAPRPDQRFDLTFRSFETVRSRNIWLGQVLPAASGLPFRTIYFDHDNFGHKAINLTSLWRWDPNKRRVAINLSGPVRLNPRWLYRFAIDARDENWDLSTTYFGHQGSLQNLILQKAEGGASLEFGLTSKLQWTTGLWMTARRFRNADASPFFANGWCLEQRNGLNYRLWSWPERRVRVDASTRLQTGRLLTGPAATFATVLGDLKGVWMPESKGEKVVVSARMRAGRTFGTLPFDELFMLGMERDNDLWLRGHVGTRAGRKGSAPLGSEYALVQTEADRTLWQPPFFRLQMGPFFDTGWIADPSRQFGSRRWMQDAGAQAKITAIGSVKLTLVYGRDLREGRGVFYVAVSRR